MLKIVLNNKQTILVNRKLSKKVIYYLNSKNFLQSLARTSNYNLKNQHLKSNRKLLKVRKYLKLF